MCNCSTRVHPGILCGSERCHCHREKTSSLLGLETMSLEEAVFTTIGAASVCWREDKVFDSTRAKQIGEDLMDKIRISVPEVETRAPLEGEGVERDIASILNRYSAENVSGTPDFVLAHYLMECLRTFNEAVHQRAAWRNETVDFTPTVD